MKLSVFSAKPYDKLFLTTDRATELDKEAGIEVIYHEFALTLETVALARGSGAVCVFVNDILDAQVLESLAQNGVQAVLLRCAGYNNVDLEAAERLDLFVANVPSYSPEAIAEFAVALIQTLNRNTHRAYNRVREANFNLDGLLGKTLHGKTIGIVGTGRIGVALARIMQGFGCKVLGFDPFQSDEFKKCGEYTDLDTLLPQCDIVSLHCPLMDKTKHLINDDSLAKMKSGAMLVNTSRGGLINTKSVIAALKRKHLGGLALDVYEGEGALFYNDHSGTIIDDDDLMRLTTFHNVLVCGHQAFFTEEALSEIGTCTLQNLADFVHKRPCKSSLVRVEAGLSRTNSIPIRI
jgi:D-lactate dehydrogenase